MNSRPPWSGLSGASSERPWEAESVKCVPAWIVWVPAPPHSQGLGWFPLFGMKCVSWPGKAGQGSAGLADSCRNVIVNWVRTFKGNDSEEQQDSAFKQVTFSWSYLHIPRSHLLASKHWKNFGLGHFRRNLRAYFRIMKAGKTYWVSRDGRSNKYYSLPPLLCFQCLGWKTGQKSKANRVRIPPFDC